jgi:hypothetical protein
MRNRTPLLAALALPALLLAGCVPAPLPTDPPDPDIPGGGVEEPGLGGPAVDEPFFDSVDQYKAELDAWRDAWLSMGCTAEVVATGEMNCALHLSGGGLIATAIQIVFSSSGVEDFDGHQQLDDLAGAQDAALASYLAAETWADENCAGADDPTCLPFATDLVDGLLDLHEELFSWAR